MRDRMFSALKRENMTQKEFASALGVSAQTVTDWKKGKNFSFTSMAMKIAPILHTSVVWLWFGTGPEYVSDEERAANEANENRKIIRMEKDIQQIGKETREFAISAIRTMMEKKHFSPQDFDREVIEDLAKKLGTTADYLLTGEGSKKRGSRPSVSESDTVSEDALKAAFFEGGEDLTQEEMDELWEDAKDYIQYKLDQRRRKKNDQ